MILRVARVEWRQWWARRDVRLAAAFVGVASLLWTWIATVGVQSGALPADIFGSEATGFAIGYKSAQTMTRVVLLLALLWASASVASDVETGSVRPVLLRVRRRELIAGKALQLWIAVLALMIVVWLLCVTVGGISLGLSGIEISGVTIHSLGGLLTSGLVAAVTASLPAGALIALGLLLSCMGPGSRAATTASLLLVVVLWGVGLFEPFDRWIFVNALDRPWTVAVSQAEGYKTESHSAGILPLLALSLLWCVALLGLASLRFDRRDLS